MKSECADEVGLLMISLNGLQSFDIFSAKNLAKQSGGGAKCLMEYLQ